MVGPLIWSTPLPITKPKATSLVRKSERNLSLRRFECRAQRDLRPFLQRKASVMQQPAKRLFDLIG